MASKPCYVCAQHLVEKKNEVRGTPSITFRVTCKRCGTYDITNFRVALIEAGTLLAQVSRDRLSHAIRIATDSHGRFGEILHENVEELVERISLPRPLEQIDRLLTFVAERTALGTRTEPEHVETWSARLGLRDATQQLGFIQEQFKNLVEFALGSSALAVKLTPLGWQRAEEVRQLRGTGNQAFVAMWFHGEMDKVFDDGLVPALKATGHSPYRVDRGAHNNKIDDEIVAQIRRSKIVVVDITGSRASVYFEAGFAMGLGIPVIWCCNSSWKAYSLEGSVGPDNPAPPQPIASTWTQHAAFDTRQHPHIFWKNAADLQDQLASRIRALGLDPAWNRGEEPTHA